MDLNSTIHAIADALARLYTHPFRHFDSVSSDYCDPVYYTPGCLPEDIFMTRAEAVAEGAALYGCSLIVAAVLGSLGYKLLRYVFAGKPCEECGKRTGCRATERYETHITRVQVGDPCCMKCQTKHEEAWSAYKKQLRAAEKARRKAERKEARRHFLEEAGDVNCQFCGNSMPPKLVRNERLVYDCSVCGSQLRAGTRSRVH